MIRNGFISNSSSCSFIVDFGVDISKFSNFVKLIEDKITDNIAEDLSEITGIDITKSDIIAILYHINLINKANYNPPYSDMINDADRLNNIGSKEELDYTDPNNIGLFEFGNEVWYDNDIIERVSSYMEGYGIGQDLFKDFKYAWVNLH